jgi:O-antigen/teichoic acid export membrane protein
MDRRNTQRPAQRTGSPLSVVLAIWHRNRDLLDNAGSLIAATGVSAGLGFVYWAYAARLFNEQAVGYASAAISAMTLFGTIGMFGLGTVLIGELPRRRNAGGLVSAALIVAGIGSLTLGLGFAIVAPHISSHLIEIGESPGRVLFFAAGVALTALSLVLDQATIGILRGGIQLARNATFAIAKLFVLSGATYIFHDAVGMGITFAWVAALLLSLILVAIRLRMTRTTLLLKPDWQLLRRLGKTALAHNWLNLAIAAPILAMPVLVTVVVSASANAAFYMAWMLASFLYLIPTNLSTVLFAIAAADPEVIAAKLRFSLRLSFAIGIVGMTVLIVTSHFVLGIFGPSYTRTGTWPLWLLIIGYIPMIPRTHYVAVCRAQNKIPRAAVILTSSAALELTGAVVGGKLDGLIGLSLALLSARIVIGLITTPSVVRASLIHGNVKVASTASHPDSRLETATYKEKQEAGVATLIALATPTVTSPAPLAAHDTPRETRAEILLRSDQPVRIERDGQQFGDLPLRPAQRPRAPVQRPARPAYMPMRPGVQRSDRRPGSGPAPELVLDNSLQTRKEAASGGAPRGEGSGSTHYE